MTRLALAWLPEADTLEKEIERDCRQVQMRDDVEVPPELTTEPWNAGASEYVMYGHFKLLHRLMPLVELSPAPWTSPGTVGRTRPLMEGVGQVSVELRREIPGFLLNR